MSSYLVTRQYSGGELEGNDVEFFGNLDDAVRYRDQRKDPQMTVLRVEPVSEPAHWDWGTRSQGSDRVMVYVSETAARNCCYAGLDVVKRRRGTTAWVPGDAA